MQLCSHHKYVLFIIFSSLKKTKLSQEAVWAAQMDLIQEQKKNLLLDRKRMTVQMEVLNLVKKSLEKREKDDKEVAERFPITDLIDMMASNI